MNPAQQRQTVMEYCVALATAAQTNNAFIITATQTAIEVQLNRLLPDEDKAEQPSIVHEPNEH